MNMCSITNSWDVAYVMHFIDKWRFDFWSVGNDLYVRIQGKWGYGTRAKSYIKFTGTAIALVSVS